MNKTKGKMTAKRTICLALSAVMCSGLTACGGVGGDNSSDKEFDPNKKQIYLGVLSEGLNESWLTPVIERFEEEYPQYQVFVDPWTNEDASEFETSVVDSRDDLFFLQGVDMASNYAKNGLIVDLTDIVTTGDPAIEDGKTIQSKLNENYDETYQYERADGTKGYYALPYAMICYGITYDADLFEAKGLYNINGYKGLDCKKGTADDFFGPDGVQGGYDDGLPATWEDFKVMMSVMRQKNVTPFVWTGEHATYRQHFVEALIANYEGAEQFRLYSTFDGVDAFSGETITIDNGYLLANRPGQRAALTAAYDIVNNVKNYSSKSFLVSNSHLGAQNEFILSERMNKPIAMLLEGTWWEHEAKATFAEMAGEYGAEYGYGKRNFKFMPLPKFIGTAGVEDQIYTGNTILDNNGNTIVCMNANSDEKEGAELFLRYVHTDESLKTFTKENGMIRPYNYTLSEEELKELSPFAQSVWAMWKDENTEVTSLAVFDDLVDRNKGFAQGVLFSGQVNSQSYSDPLSNFYKYQDLTVDAYMTAKTTLYTAARWALNVNNV